MPISPTPLCCWLGPDSHGRNVSRSDYNVTSGLKQLRSEGDFLPFTNEVKKSRGRLVQSSNDGLFKSSITAEWQGQPDGVRRLATCRGWNKRVNILRMTELCFSLKGGRYQYEKGTARMNLVVLSLSFQTATVGVN